MTINRLFRGNVCQVVGDVDDDDLDDEDEFEDDGDDSDTEDDEEEDDEEEETWQVFRGSIPLKGASSLTSGIELPRLAGISSRAKAGSTRLGCVPTAFSSQAPVTG